MEQALLLLADGAQYRAPEYSLAETVIGLMATLSGIATFVVALRRGSGHYGRGS